MARKYSHCTNASPRIPNAARNGSSRRVTRRLAGRTRASTATRPIAAPVIRTSVNRSDDRPEARMTFETTPLTANSVAAEKTMT